MAAKKAGARGRTPEQIKEHYEIEKELASKLKSAAPQERTRLYASLYDELYRRVPSHSHFTTPEGEKLKEVSSQIRLLQPFVHASTNFLEIGPGRCALSFAMASRVKQVYAVDVSEVITQNTERPPNFHLLLSDGVAIPLPEKSIDVAFSHQLMEHLHPDDAFKQLQNIYKTLVPGGVYLCVTPNRISGPWDISRNFDTVASGFHLHEYTNTELASIFKQVGFSKVSVYVRGVTAYMRVPSLTAVKWYETVLNTIPPSPRRRLARWGLPNIRILGIKE